jgi:hypothetical protein
MVVLSRTGEIIAALTDCHPAYVWPSQCRFRVAQPNPSLSACVLIRGVSIIPMSMGMFAIADAGLPFTSYTLPTLNPNYRSQ